MPGSQTKRRRQHALNRVRYDVAMKLCIVSDSHDRADPLAEAVRSGAADGAAAVIHCGDIIGTQTLRAAMSVGLPLHVIHGNNLGDPVSLSRWAQESDGLLYYHGADARLDLAGRRIFVVHYPEYGYAMACTGDWDLVCCGHSHVAGIERVPNVKNGVTWLVNPGTVAGLAAPATWILGDLVEMRFDIRIVNAEVARS
jgi:putative phosphoesterase